MTGFAVATRGRYGIDVETKDIGRTKPESDVDTAEDEYQNMEDEDGIVLKHFANYGNTENTM